VVVPVQDEVSSHALVGSGAKVRVIAHGESWPVREVKSALKDSEGPAKLGRSAGGLPRWPSAEGLELAQIPVAALRCSQKVFAQCLRIA
jgi:hypothetical protein